MRSRGVCTYLVFVAAVTMPTFERSRVESLALLEGRIKHRDQRQCRRYAYVAIATGNAGFGHRFADIVFTFAFAQKINATPVFQFVNMNPGLGTRQYPWAREYLGLPIELDLQPFITSTTITKKEVRNILAAEPDEMCDVLFNSCDLCCGGCCFHNFPNSFNMMRPSVQRFFESTQWGSEHRRWTLGRPSCLSLAVHIRTGDITLGCGGQNSADELLVSLLSRVAPLCSDVHFVSQFAVDPACTTLLRNLTNVQITEHLSDDVRDSARVFLSADVLVSTGSSLPIAFATLSRWVVHIAGMPKENSRVAYQLDTDIAYDRGRQLSSDDIARLCMMVFDRRGARFPGCHRRFLEVSQPHSGRELHSSSRAVARDRARTGP